MGLPPADGMVSFGAGPFLRPRSMSGGYHLSSPYMCMCIYDYVICGTEFPCLEPPKEGTPKKWNPKKPRMAPLLGLRGSIGGPSQPSSELWLFLPRIGPPRTPPRMTRHTILLLGLNPVFEGHGDSLGPFKSFFNLWVPLLK